MEWTDWFLPTLYTLNLRCLIFTFPVMKTGKHKVCSWNGRKKIKGALPSVQGTCTVFKSPFDSRFQLRLASCPYYMDTACIKVQT